MTGQISARGSPEARGNRSGSYSSPRRTSRATGLGGGGSTEQGGSAAEENGGGGAPVRIGRGEVVGKVCEGEAELLVVLV